ncbi:MAG: hypothetical protein K1W34_13245 [Lachnospiraceae bacterium]
MPKSKGVKVEIYIIFLMYWKGGEKMYIKIYTKSQLILLRRLRPLFKKKYRLPKEIVDNVHHILKSKMLGTKGFIAILLNTVSDDMAEIRDILDCYPQKLRISDDITGISIPDNKKWLTKGREWYIDSLELKENNDSDCSHIYVIYSMTLKDLYGDEG